MWIIQTEKSLWPLSWGEGYSKLRPRQVRPWLYLPALGGASIHRSVQNCESTDKLPHAAPRCCVVTASAWSPEAMAPVAAGGESEALGWTGVSMKSVNVAERR